MIERIHIENFKSIYDLDINLGRVNLFIGENGSGKSNLLEALVFVSANQSNKLDNEFLSSRGLRVTNPILMRSAFFEKDKYANIIISLQFDDNEELNYEFSNDNLVYSKWEEVEELTETIELKDNTIERLENLKKEMKLGTVSKALEYLISNISGVHIENFIIYSPENTALRTFEKEGQIQPLGINGEGLLKLLKVVNNYEDKSYINTIISSLQLFDWFEDIHIPDGLSYGEDKVVIKDKYLYQEIDQRSTNEGFLFILFYITLIVAKETPKAFAIDNIDASLNPKLCTKLMLIINDLAKKYEKQVFLTTHNPAVLDGIDLNEEEQKLFVVSRNKSGHTRMKNITVENKPKSSNDEPLKLSEAFLRGYLGGLPKGF
ncbi:MAG: ATP-binding protein [Campylobacterota bacterium]|nr:ATP-binding protein [Campylobacterota bacterium]